MIGIFLLFPHLSCCWQSSHHVTASPRYLLDKAARYHGNWLAVRASYGMNGIFLPSPDLETFAAYLVKHQVRSGQVGRGGRSR